jgi:WS/DGAT/MGAT family acyltransferase
MGYTHYDRLSALDAAFLEIEDPSALMHVGAVAIFELGALRTPDGGLDIERIRAAAVPMLRASPRLRQRLDWIPLLDHPVWVDDDRFNLAYHLRHTALPEPGDERLLKRLAGRIFSQQLDRGKPLWEMWYVEGLEGDRFAVIGKFHHCMLDGVAGAHLVGLMFGSDLADPMDEPAPRWLPRPAPGGARLLADELLRRATLPLRAASAGAEALRRPWRALSAARGVGESLLATARQAISPATATPLNVEIGSHRRFDWLKSDLSTLRDVKTRLDGTVNDVVLATVSGALRRFLRARGLRLEELDVRALVPVNVRADDERGDLGNRVAFMVARLPLDEADPARRLARVCAETRRLKRSRQVEGAELIEQISDWTDTAVFARYARLGASRAFNLVVTNVPGPRETARLLGSRLVEIYPLVPLYRNQALGIALFSYDGALHWGLNGDWDAMPDLHDLALALEHEVEALGKAAAGPPHGD